MNELNELIEQLYKEHTSASKPKDRVAGGLSAIANPAEDARISRIRQVLIEMGSLLKAEDQPVVDVEPPTETICLRILNHWESMTHSLHGIKQHMLSLEQDIVKMQPWGNFDVMKVEQLATEGCHIRFWTMPIPKFALYSAEATDQSVRFYPVTQDSEFCYFVTVSEGQETLRMPDGASEVEICPCPVSTLIMLQTRDKDTLKKMETLLGDYALVHYGEVYASLRQALPPGAPMPTLEPAHKGLRHKLHQIFHK